MKKFTLIAIVALVMAGCSKDETPKTTYHIINQIEKSNSSIEYLDGTLYEVVAFCYQGDNIVSEDNLEPIPSGGGVSETIEVSPQIERVRVSFKLLPRESEYYDYPLNIRVYTVTTWLIVEAKNNEIIITGNTMTQKTLD